MDVSPLKETQEDIILQTPFTEDIRQPHIGEDDEDEDEEETKT